MTTQTLSTIRNITVAQVAERYGCSDKIVRDWVQNGQLIGIDVSRTGCKNKRWKFSEADLALMEQKRSSQPTTPSNKAKPATKKARGRKTTGMKFNPATGSFE